MDTATRDRNIATWLGDAPQPVRDTTNQLLERIALLRAEQTIYPAQDDILNALAYTPADKVKVVILGQDPYHGPNQAMGLSFSVPATQTKLPPSLRNIYKELKADLGCPIPATGDLTPWAQQGVLLLNTTLTVREHAANSHAKLGWSTLTDYVIERCCQLPQPVVFLAWGRFAQQMVEGKLAATGAGKTTIVNLLMRFYDVDSGSILLSGRDIADYSRASTRDRFGMVLQDTWLFEGTVRENLVYNLSDVTDEQLNRVCRACGLDKFVRSLPDGFDTVLSESTSISAGQKQLLTIARAMLQNAPMLILDEATSSVDTRTELLIQRAMDKLTENRTSFVIAHRLSTIKNADLILVMKDGDIIESGTHETLMQRNGFYAALYNSQFEQAS